MWGCILEVRRLRSLVLPVSVYGFEVFQKFDKALCLRVVASAFPFFDILGWRVCVLAIGEEIEILVDISELAAFLGDGEVSKLLHQDFQNLCDIISRTIIKSSKQEKRSSAPTRNALVIR